MDGRMDGKQMVGRMGGWIDEFWLYVFIYLIRIEDKDASGELLI